MLDESLLFVFSKHLSLKVGKKKNTNLLSLKKIRKNKLICKLKIKYSPANKHGVSFRLSVMTYLNFCFILRSEKTVDSFSEQRYNGYRSNSYFE